MKGDEFHALFMLLENSALKLNLYLFIIESSISAKLGLTK